MVKKEGFWIMVITSVPVADPPPKMGIFWATPWPDKQKYHDQIERLARIRYIWDEPAEKMIENVLDKDEDYFFDEVYRGYEPNWNKAVRVRYHGEDIRLFAHEFSRVSKENMDVYVTDPNAFVLMPYDVQGDMLMDFVLNKNYLPTYEAALLDGCGHNLAQLVALGLDFDAEYPPVGYYAPSEELTAIFGER